MVLFLFATAISILAVIAFSVLTVVMVLLADWEEEDGSKPSQRTKSWEATPAGHEPDGLWQSCRN